MFTNGKKYYGPDADEGGGENEQAAEETTAQTAEVEAAVIPEETAGAEGENTTGITDEEIAAALEGADYSTAFSKPDAAAPNADASAEAQASAAHSAEIDSLNATIADRDATIAALQSANQHINHPIVEAAIALANSNETDVTKLVSIMAGDIPDPSTMSPEAKYAMYVRNVIAPEAGLSEDGINSLIAKFQNKDPEDRITETVEANKYLKAERNAKLQEFQTKLKAYKGITPVATESKISEDVLNQVRSQTVEYVKGFVGKKFNHMDFTESDNAQVMGLLNEGFFLWDQNGKPLLKESVMAAHYLLNRKNYDAALIRKGFDMKVRSSVDGIPRVSHVPGSQTSVGGARGNTKLDDHLKNLEFLPK